VTDRTASGALAVTGIVAITVGVLSILAATTGLLPNWLAVESWLSTWLVALLVLLVGALVYFGGSSGTRSTRRPLTDTKPTTVTTPARFGEALSTCVMLPDPEGARSELRKTAITVMTLRTGCSEATAEERLRAGTWTTDRVAAAMLGGDDAPSFRFGERLQELLLPQRTLRYRTERAVAAIEAIDPSDAGERGEADGVTATDTGQVSPTFIDAFDDAMPDEGERGVGTGERRSGAGERRTGVGERRSDAGERRSGDQPVEGASRTPEANAATDRVRSPDDDRPRRSASGDDWVTEESSDGVGGSLDA